MNFETGPSNDVQYSKDRLSDLRTRETNLNEIEKQELATYNKWGRNSEAFVLDMKEQAGTASSEEKAKLAAFTEFRRQDQDFERRLALKELTSNLTENEKAAMEILRRANKENRTTTSEEHEKINEFLEKDLGSA